MLTKLRASLDDPWTKGLVIAAVVLAILAIVLLLAGCGEEGAEGASGGCTGTVTKTYTEYKAGVGIQSGSVTIPTGNTRYYIAVKRDDGTYCSQRLDKSEWLAVTEGDTYG
jgi:hypothetical protein